MPSSDAWVTLTTFNWLQDALMLKTRLEGSGVRVMIPEEHIASINPMGTAMQVHVLVPATELIRAREVADLPVEPAADTGADEEPCPHCGSKNVKRKAAGLKNLLMLLLAFFAFIPVRRNEKKICGDCGRVLPRK